MVNRLTLQKQQGVLATSPIRRTNKIDSVSSIDATVTIAVVAGLATTAFFKPKPQCRVFIAVNHFPFEGACLGVS